MKNTLRLHVLLVFLLILSACATVKNQMNDSDFMAQNQPVRELKILVASDGSHTKDQIDQFLQECSEIFREQVGITFIPLKYIWIQWENRDVIPMLEELARSTEGYEFDLAIGFTRWTTGELLTRNLVGAWEGCIDDTYRRYIVVKHLDKRTLLHEVGHAFIFSHAHSNSGLMMPVSFQIVPFIPIKFESIYLSSEDRIEVLKNKGRQFAQIPMIASREHVLAKTTRSRPSPLWPEIR